MYILYKDTSRTLSTNLNKQNTALYEHQQQFIDIPRTALVLI